MIKRPRRDDERGATAVIVALLATVLFTAAALAVDISNLAMERQNLHDHIDSAAHAGAYELPHNPTGAVMKARQIAQAQDPEIDPETELFCVVASTGLDRQVNTDQIPSTCLPGPPPYTVANYPRLRCNDIICAIPCPVSTTTQCNTMHVWDSKTVDHSFGPVFGNDTGETGAVASTACRGSCGTETPNPMDIVVVADRSPSMVEPHFSQMKDAILDSLTTMSPELHYVAFSALHKSTGYGTCPTSTVPWNSALGGTNYTRWQNNIAAGTWVPVPFSNDYLIGEDTVNTSSTLARAVNCMPHGNVSGYSGGNYGTHLSGALKGAGRYLLGLETNNLGSLPARPGEAPKKVILFETDGSPDEVFMGGSTNVGVAGDIGSGPQANYTGVPSGVSVDSNRGQLACDQLRQVATSLKNRQVTIITIGFGQAGTARCNRHTNSGNRVRDVLAAAASPNSDGEQASASNCSIASERVAENTDGDYFFCAAAGNELKDIFKTALSQVGGGIKLIRMP